MAHIADSGPKSGYEAKTGHHPFPGIPKHSDPVGVIESMAGLAHGQAEGDDAMDAKEQGRKGGTNLNPSKTKVP